MTILLWTAAFIIGVALIVWGAERFAEHLGAASVRLGVSSFALALLLAGAEPEELATVIAASLSDAPAIALGDVIGANIAICLVALGVGAWIAPLPFSKRVMRYAVLGIPLGGIATWIAWEGRIDRGEGALLVALYVAYVAIIWLLERRPPSLGEVHELQEARLKVTRGGHQAPVGRKLLPVIDGVIAMAVGAGLMVKAIQHVADVEAAQTVVALTIVGFVTAFELVVLAWSAGRRGAGEAVVAGVVGSFAYNVTMTLGAGALVRPLQIQAASSLHLPWLAMLAALGLVILLAAPKASLGRRSAAILLSAYGLFIAAILLLMPG